MDFHPQVATVVVSANTGFHHALLVPALPEPCVYVLVWSQGLTHYSKKFKAGNLADLSDVRAAPILDLSSPVFDWTLKTSWKQLNAVIVRLAIAKTEVKKLLRDFQKQLQAYGENLYGKADVGRDNASGLRSGGGWPYTTFACSMRSIASWQSVFESVLDLDGRSQSAYPMHSTFEPIGYTRSTDPFAGLTAHRDNAIVHGTKDCFVLQSAAVLYPNPKGALRLSCFSSRVPMTLWCYRQCLLQLATRYSSTEVGLTSRGPKDRPAMQNVFGGNYVGFAAASKMSNTELLNFIRRNTAKTIQSLIPNAPTTAASHEFSKELEAYVAKHVGRPVSSIQQLKNVILADGPRRALARALAGKMSSAKLWAALPGGPIIVAQAVWKAVHDYGDKKLLLQWILHEGSGGKNRKASELDYSQAVGDARKRLKRV